MYYNFEHNDPLRTRRKNINKEKKTKHKYIVHTQLQTDKQKTRKKTPQYILLYLHEKINN